MVQIAKLTADLFANTSRFEQGMRRAQGTLGRFGSYTNSTMARSSRSFDSFGSKVSVADRSVAAITSRIAVLGATVASALSVQKIVQYSDTWKQLEGRLKIVTGDSTELAAAQERLFKIAQDTRQPLESVTNLYTRLNLALGENKRAQYDVAGISETIAKALAVTGEGAAQAQSAILQFSQAVQSDFKGSAQEINSLLDSAPRLAQALQKSFGDGSKSLKQLAKDGELSTEKVLRALEPLAAQAQEISGEFENIQLTVGQALTQLDNAFLRFIGQSDLAASGTSSLAAAISTLASNFGVLATSVSAIALVFTGRLIGALVASATAFVSNQLAMAAAARQAALTSAAYLGLASAATSAAGATTLLTRALAFFGGPVGVGITAVGAAMLLLANNTDEAFESQQRMNKALTDSQAVVTQLEKSNYDLATATGENKNQIAAQNVELRRNTQLQLDNIKVMITRAETQLKLAQAVEKEAAAFASNKGFFNFGAKLGSLNKANDAQDKQIDQLKQLGQLYRELNQLESALAGGTGSSGGSGAKGGAAAQVVTQKELGKTVKDTTREIKDQGEQITDNKDFARDFGLTFSSALEDAIVEGKKLSDVMKALGDDILRILTRKAVTEPLGNAFSSIFETSGIGSIFSGLLPSFAVGTDYVPHDMVAQIHKGERIVPAHENRGMGGDININIQNNAGARVSATANETGSGMDINVMIDQAVADNMLRRGSRTNQALGAFSSQSLIRR